MQKLFLGLLVFIPIAIGSSYTTLSPIAVFFLCIAAIIPLAKFIGEATEQISEHTDPALGGFLNATFGNATELIVGVLALRAGLLDVIRATIAGSIIGNLLLAIGLSMFIGGWRHKKQTFNREGISAMGTTLLLSSIALITPAIFAQTVSSATPSAVEHLSVFVSLILIVVYIGGLIFSLRTHKHLYISDVETQDPHWSKNASIAVLFVATLTVVWVSDILVNAITPVVAAIGWSPVFVSIVFVAIAGNAAEYASAITAAAKNRMDLALQITMGSAAQIAQFVGPVLILLSLLFATPLSLIFTPYELVAIALSTFIANFVILDGESNWLEGMQLIAAYLIIAAGFFLYQ